MRIDWSDEIDEILAGDLAAGFTYATPAKGVVIAPMAPLGIRDRDRGRVVVTTSLGLPKKLERIRANDQVAIAYHAREHGLSDRPEFVLVQGRASFGAPDRDWLEAKTPEFERFLGPRAGGLTGRWLEVYYWERVAIEVDVERIVVWDDPACTTAPRVLGAALPSEPPPPQKAPRNGTAPRFPVAGVAAHAQRLPHTLLGWIGADGYPMVVSATTGASTDADGIVLETGTGAPVPPGGRRAGLTSHTFRPRMIGQEQRIHTGWLEGGSGPEDEVRYSPHTKAGYKLPSSKALMHFGAGMQTRIGLRKAREAGLTAG